MYGFPYGSLKMRVKRFSGMSENYRKAEPLWHRAPVTMLAFRTLIVTALPLLASCSTFQQCTRHTATPHFSPVLDSLQCYNDFTSHIRCTWEEDPHTHLDVSVESKIIRESPCVSDSRGALLPSGKTVRSCLYKTQFFTLGSHTIYFNASCPFKATVLNIAQQAKALSPVNLTVREAEDGGHVLRWSSPYSPSSHHTLTYQLKYRRHGNDWTVMNNTTSSELVIEKTALSPGYLYEARVRARGRVGLWSAWSHKVSWMTGEEGVLNMQCTLVNDGLTCSWQVKREHMQVFSYHLCWRTHGESQQCKHCSIQTREMQQPNALQDFTCSVVSSTPELLTVEIQTRHASKDFINPLNFQPTFPPNVHVDNNDGVWKVKWSRPQVSRKVQLSYQVCVRRSATQGSEECYSIMDDVYSFHIPRSFVLHNTEYMVLVRALPGQGYAGRPSDWSTPVFFTTDSGPAISTIIYVLIGVFMVAFSIILYNALPACHRRFKMWKVSIPSPIKSKVLEEISSRKLTAGLAYNEKTSLCIIQTSDNPIIYKGSILENPCLPHIDDSSRSITMMKKDWTHGSIGSTSSTQDTSGMSFLGPYILCCQESVDESQTDSSDTCFSSMLSYDEENVSVSKSTSDSPPGTGGYVFSPPTFLPSPDDSTPSNPAGLSREPSLEELQKGSPPAYSPSPAGMPVFTHPSGYCLMPRMDMSVAGWSQAPVSPPEGGRESQSSKMTEGDNNACNYVTLSQPGV